MTKLVYLTDSYKKTLSAHLSSLVKKGDHYEATLDQTIFYPLGGGQPSDKGVITGKHGKLEITHVRMPGSQVIHEGKLSGELQIGEAIIITIDWHLRFNHMRWHSAGHLLHEVAMSTVPGLAPVRGEHGKHGYIEYRGSINPTLLETLQKKVQMEIAANKHFTTKMVTVEELKATSSWVPERLPKNKPLRVLQIEGYGPIPDGGTQVKNSAEIGEIRITRIEQSNDLVRVYYIVPTSQQKSAASTFVSILTLDTFRALILEQQNELLSALAQATPVQAEQLKVRYFGSSGRATQLIRRLTELPETERKTAGLLVNEFKNSITQTLTVKLKQVEVNQEGWFDVSLPGIRPPLGHLHIVTQAIMEITRIFERIGFTRVRHPEVDWDWYPFESLNMPPNHPARDELETFFIESQKSKVKSQKYAKSNESKFSKMVLTPHTSNGQVREMEKGALPIRMINITKCYRRQSDVSHVPMFYQFEGLYVDKNVSIGHLKGVMDYFFKQYYGSERKSRLRPFHFQFTEPSFEVDINCGICLGKGCKLCKDGWLELGGAGMVHPNVLHSGGIDPDKYNGFAFGWGVERVAMMKSGTQLDDIRLLYSNDLRFLEQF